ncbi:MAG: hypothetical protein ABW199_00410 [Caulobacterales bacterium]
MLEKALNSLVGLTIVCASAALAVFAGGFAVYAIVAPQLGPAGAAAVVAAVAASIVGITGVIRLVRAQQRERESVLARHELAAGLPEPLRGVMQDHPLAAIAVTVLGGVVAARNPRIIREVIRALRPIDD